MHRRAVRRCAACNVFIRGRRDKKTCSARCRMRLTRQRRRTAVIRTQSAGPEKGDV